MAEHEQAPNDLTIKISTLDFMPSSLASGSDSHNSPSLVSPPSSAFVSALQSPYISPRAAVPTSSTDDIPSSSYTPPSDQYDYSDDLKFITRLQAQQHPAPSRFSFSFPVSFSPTSNAKLWTYDVFIGFHGHNRNLLRFCKWLKSELELQGIACFVADRSTYTDTHNYEIADRVISSVTYGVIVVTPCTFHNCLNMEEIRFFSQKKNLIPLFFGTGSNQIMGLLNSSSINKESREAVDGLIKCDEYKLQANEGNWRSCITKAAGVLGAKLGRKCVADKDDGFEELPFPRNRFFVGREKEIMEMESAFFGFGDSHEQDDSLTRVKHSSGESQGLAVAGEESKSDTALRGGKFINLELGKCKDPKEAWAEPGAEKSSLKRLKYKKLNSDNSSSVVCLSGIAGIGKTELALEFAHRYSQRYKMVLWVGGEARYLRQNILNISLKLGFDASIDAQKETARFHSFEEQEFEAFKRVKRELFRDMPYLVIIDNLETEKEWCEVKDLHDPVQRNTGGSHVIITTRLPKVMNWNIKQLQPLPVSDAMVLLRGRRNKEYPGEELEFLAKFDKKLGRLTFGLWVVGSLLSELGTTPSALFQAVNQVSLEVDGSTSSYLSISDEQYCQNNLFLMKVLCFCFAILQETSKSKKLLASKMLLVGAWFAPAPISGSLLATAANNVLAAGSRLRRWTRGLRPTFGCCAGFGLPSQSEEESSLLLVKLGLARRSNKRPGCWIQFHPITQVVARKKENLLAAEAAVLSIGRISNPVVHSDHLWASAYLVFGFKYEPSIVQLKAIDMVLYIRQTALPLALGAFTNFSRCNSALELLKVCTNVLEEVEKSFVSQIQEDWCHGSLCWNSKLQVKKRVDEYVWQDVTLLKATLLESRAKLLVRGGHFDSGEKLCRTCISIRTVMLGHNHALTLVAQETLANLVRTRSRI